MQSLTDVYKITSLLYENDQTIIYRALREEDGREVILKTHKKPEDIHRIQHEFDLLKTRRIEGIANVIDIFANNVESTYLVSEDTGAMVMEQYLQENTVDEAEFLRIAQSAAQALASIHAEKIIHRDIKPANMLINPETLEVWYIDFGISAQVKRGEDLWQESAAGTLEYISPEQTGRIHHVVDFRSDIYSLGVVFYRLLTGRLPFVGASAMELIHAHIAVIPENPAELASVHEIVAKGVLMMLEKRPENRYQTADAIVYDIRRVESLIASGEDTGRFLLAEKDIFYNLENGRKIYGKKKVLDRLIGAYPDNRKHETEIVLLEGPEASGKTLLLNALEQEVRSGGGMVFRAASVISEQSEPYSALRHLFEGIVDKISAAGLSLPGTGEKILLQLGENAQALIDILPGMENLIGKQRPIPRLSVAENQRRAVAVLRAFLQIICSVPRPTLFIVDNLQSVDEASSRLLLSALEDVSMMNAMFVFAYRNDPAAATEEFYGLVNEIKSKMKHHQTLRIEDMTVEDIAVMIDDIFPQETESVRELARFVYTYSERNMRRVEYFLKDMYHSGVIRMNESMDGWEWDKRALLELTNTDALLKFKEMYCALPPKSQFCLKMLACLRVAFGRELAEFTFGEDASFDEVMEAVKPFKEAGLFLYDETTAMYSFISTSILDTIAEMMDPAEKKRMHYTIGRRLYEATKDDEYALLKKSPLINMQFFQADPAQIADFDRERVLLMNKLAGDRAMTSSDLESARRHYEMALRLMGDTPLEKNYAVAFPMLLNIATCSFSRDDLEGSAEAFRVLTKAAEGPKDRYTVFITAIRQFLSVTDWRHAEEFALAYLEGSALLPPKDADIDALMMEQQQRLVQNFAEKGMDFVSAVMIADDEARHAGSMLAILTEVSLMNASENTMYYIFRAANYAYEMGVYPELERVLACMAERTAAQGNYEEAKRIIDVGLAYAEQHSRPQSVLWMTYCTVIVHWVEPLAEIPEIYQRAKRATLMEGMPYYGAFVDMMLIMYYLDVGEKLSAASKDIEAALYNAQRNYLDNISIVFYAAFRQFARCMMGKTKSLESFDDAHFSEQEAIEDVPLEYRRYIGQFYYVYRIKALYVGGYFEEAVAYAEKMEELLPYKLFSAAFLSRIQYYYYYTLALIRCCEKDESLIEKYRPLLEDNLEELKKYADTHPENFSVRYQLAKLATERLDGVEPFQYFERISQIDKEFQTRNLLWDQVIVEEWFIDYWQKKKVRQYQDIHASRTLEIYKKLGAKAKILQLAGQMPAEALQSSQNTYSTSTLMPSYSSGGMSSDTSSLNSTLDYQAILHIISCLASETDLDSFVDQFLTLLMRNGGAEQALMFLIRDDEIFLQAISTSDRSTLGVVSKELPLPIEQIDEGVIPARVVEFVTSKRIRLMANSSDDEYAAIDDAYMKANRPESFICLPIVAKNDVIGAVYLENKRLPGVFPPQRARFLDTVVLQASLLIRNTMEVRNLEGYTVDLEKRLSSYIGQLNTLIAGIAHEINSPLGVCVTVASRLFEEAKEVLRQYEARTLSKTTFHEYVHENHDGLDILFNNVVRASDLVQNFKKISVDQSNEVFEDLELMGALRNIVEYIRPAVKKKIASCTVEGPETLYFHTSTGVLAQIFTNLIMNSAIHGFGSMEKEDCHVTIDVSEDDDAVHIAYADNGRGMSQEERENVFIPFYTTRRTEGGSGLGGHILMSLITQTLGGSIQCTSMPGMGTRFFIKLPKQINQKVKNEHV